MEPAMHARPPRPGRRTQSGLAARSSSSQSVASSASAHSDVSSNSRSNSRSNMPLPRSPLAQSSALPTNDEEGDENDNGTLSSHAHKSHDDDAQTPHLGLGLSMASLSTEHVSAGPSDARSAHGASEIPLEAVENALKDLTRDDLVLALKRAKEQMDTLEDRLEAMTERNEILQGAGNDLSAQIHSLEGDRTSLEFALSHREERIDELMREQDRLEEDVYLRTEVNERLRKQLEEAEKARAESERRYNEQTTSIDRERQYYLDQEKLFMTQKAKSSSAYDRVHTAQQELLRENERLQAQVSQLRSSSPLRAKSQAVASVPSQESNLGNASKAETDDVQDGVDNENGDAAATLGSSSAARTLLSETDAAIEVDSLRSEHEALQKSHSSLTETMQQLQAELREMRTSNADLRQQNQMFADILQEKTINGDLATASAFLNRQYQPFDGETSSDADSSRETTDMDDVPDSPTGEKMRRSQSTQRRDRQVSSGMHASGSLANELEDAGDAGAKDSSAKTHRKRNSTTISSDIPTLQREVRELRESCQALTLYINKILDRIIAKEGYENVLAVDNEQRRTLRAKASRMHMSSGEPSSSSPEKTTRFSRAGLGRGLPSTWEEDQPSTPKNSTSPSERARKTMSRDWRSFLPIMGATPPSAQAGDASGVGFARRIRSDEEIEDKRDEQERERIRQTMMKQGIKLPEHQLRSQKRQSTSLGTFISRVMGRTNEGDESTSSVGSASLQPGPMERTSSGQEASVASSTASETESSTLSTREMRQRALDADDASDNLTDVPDRRESRMHRLSASRVASSGAGAMSPQRQASQLEAEKSKIPNEVIGDLSRGPSEAGDESYGYHLKSSQPGTPLAPATEEQGDTPGWRKAFKRMSLLYPSSTVAVASPDSSNAEPKSPASPSPSGT